MRIKPTGPTPPRLYSAGKGLFPSVTEVLKVVEKPHVDNWRRRVGQKEADRVMESAKVFGTRLHAAAQRVAWGEGVEEDMRPYADAVRSFLAGRVLEVLGTEVELVSPRLKFGGTLDLWCQLKDGSYAVVDYKTTSGLTREHGLQTAAYALLCREHGMRVNKRLVVRIKKEKPGAFYCRTFDDHAGDVEAFVSLLRFWWWRHRAAMEKRKGKV